MKPSSASTILHLAGKMKRQTNFITRRARRRVRPLASFISFGVLFLLLIATAFNTVSSATSRNKVARNAQQRSSIPDAKLPGKSPINRGNKSASTSAKVDPFGAKAFFRMLMLMPDPPSEAISTYAAPGGICDTSSPKDTFNLGDWVCAQISDAPLRAEAPLRRVSFSGTSGVLVDTTLTDVITNPQTIVFKLPTTTTSDIDGVPVDNRGIWSANLNSTADNTTRAITYFSVADPLNAAADLAIYNFSTSPDPVQPGNATGFFLWIKNYGPNDAQNVHVKQVVPPNMTFSSVSAGNGTAFTCSANLGVVDCTVALPQNAQPGDASPPLAKDAVSTFTINYSVSSGASSTAITSDVTITSDTNDPRQASNTSSARVEVRASGAPPATCTLGCPADMTVVANTTQNNQSGAFVNFAGNIEASGDCGTVQTSPISGSFFPVGSTNVSVSAGGGGACSFVVKVIDASAAPTITCGDAISVQAADGACEATVNVTAPTATGTGVTVTGTRSDSQTINSPYPAGTTVITWTAMDSSNRSVSCTQTVTVTANDTVKPTLTLPLDINMATPAGTTGACGMVIGETELGKATADDNCSATVNVVRTGVPAGNFFPVGTTNITYTATDGAGNTSTGVQHVTVTDGTAPLIAAPPDASYTCLSQVPAADVNQATRGEVLDENGNPLPPGPPSDNCGMPNVSVAETRSGAGNASSPLIISRTFTATDSAGNTASSTQTITVIDSVPPSLVLNGPSSVTVECHTTFNDLGATASDTCTTNVPVVVGGNLNVNVPGTYTVTYDASDEAGNAAPQVSRTVTVVDTTPPTLSCPADITVYLPLNSTATSMVVNYQTPVGTDTCATTTTTTTQTAGLPSGAAFPVGTTTNTFVADDGNGHTVSCSFNVRVLYDFTGFFSPILNQPTVNVVKAGQGVPVKFSLSGNKGLNIFAVNSPASAPVACGSDPNVDLTGTVTAGGSSLSYDASTDQYIYVWKTDSSWTGTCRQLVVTLNDGSIHRANFKFK